MIKFLVFPALAARPFSNGLMVVMVAFAVALLGLTLGIGQGIDRVFSGNARNVDIVVGAKGSPLQLVLSSLYHMDVPTGNIELAATEFLHRHKQVAQIIPLAMGDSYHGFPIIGTMPADYISIYAGKIETGGAALKPFDAIAGASTGLKPGDNFAGIHGLSEDGGHAHDDHHYTVTGVLGRTGTILDRSIITSIESVHDLHAGHHHGHDDDDDDHHDSDAEVTALLIRTKTPLANMTLPREINMKTGLMAASPSMEMARLSKMIGMGRDGVTGIAVLFCLLAAGMIFSGLSATLSQRQYDFALLRAMGMGRRRVFAVILSEAAITGAAGITLGLVAAVVISRMLPGYITISFCTLGLVGAGAFVLCLLAGAVPALRIMRGNIQTLLSREGF